MTQWLATADRRIAYIIDSKTKSSALSSNSKYRDFARFTIKTPTATNNSSMLLRLIAIARNQPTVSTNGRF